MGGVISDGKGDESTWLVAGWAFRGYLDRVLAEVRYDRAAADAVESALAFQGLLLDHVDPITLARLRPVLVRVADEVISGLWPVHVEGRRLDDRSQEQFREAVGELRAMFARWWPAET